MSILIQTDPKDKSVVETLKPRIKKINNVDIIEDDVSTYQPTGEELARRQEIVHDFTWGHVTMYKPRREFNDLSLVSRLTIDKMAFNTYQPNDGDALEGDEINAWKSRAVKPIIRNKAFSIAAHATARLLFPRIFAYNQLDEEEEDAATVMESLQEWAADRSNYAKTSMYAVITALWSPAAIIETYYAETYRDVKKEKVGGKWVTESMCDENLSGFMDEVVPADELYIENFYESDIQRQGWLIRRRVQAYSLLRAKYEKKYSNFKYVKPGIQIVYNDANQLFYEVYDTNMRQEMGEEVRYWRKADDLMLIMVNGVLLTESDNPNPRNDKMYPFDKFGYSTFDEGRCFYYKSLAFAMSPEAKIINTLYPLVIDGTYLSVMPPMINIGSEVISADVVIPGAVTTLQDPNADLKPLSIGQNNMGLRSGFEALKTVEESLNASSIEPTQAGAPQPGDKTAYEISRMEQNAATVLGLFVKMIAEHVRNFGYLRLGDIIQYLTIPEVKTILGHVSDQLVYKTFYLYNKGEGARTRRIKFSNDLPSGYMTEEELLKESYKTLQEQGGLKSKTDLYRVNPQLIRNLKYMFSITPDILNPMSEELERAFRLEEYDRAIQNQTLDQEEVTRVFLLGAYPASKRDPDKFINKQKPPAAVPQNNQDSPLAMLKGNQVAPQAAGIAQK